MATKKPSLFRKAKAWIKSFELYKELDFFVSYTASYVTNALKDYRQFDEIVPGVYLGAMPMRRTNVDIVNHHEKIMATAKSKKKPIGIVVSVTEDKEKLSGIFYEPAKWPTHIKTMSVRIPDYSATKDKIKKEQYNETYAAVKAIEDTIANNQSAYVHCKAGKSRSVFVLMCYLTTVYRTPGPDGRALEISEAYQLIKRLRPQVTFESKEKFAAVEEFKQRFGFEKRVEKQPKKQVKVESPVINIPINKNRQNGDDTISNFVKTKKFIHPRIHQLSLSLFSRKKMKEQAEQAQAIHSNSFR